MNLDRNTLFSSVEIEIGKINKDQEKTATEERDSLKQTSHINQTQ